MSIDDFQKRYGMVIRLHCDQVAEYQKLHANVWPTVLRMISECNIRNYSIFLKQLDDSNYYLFSYFEYIGTDFDADMKKMADDSETQRWWELCRPCQQPLASATGNEWWVSMKEVFHHP